MGKNVSDFLKAMSPVVRKQFFLFVNWFDYSVRNFFKARDGQPLGISFMDFALFDLDFS